MWEIDWAIPIDEGGRPWDSYDWILDAASELGSRDVTVVGATYGHLGALSFAIGASEASALRVGPHAYTVGGITVHGATLRGHFTVRGPVLAASATDETLSVIEGKNPLAVAAVAAWPDDIATWRATHAPTRIGQVRADQEAEFSTQVLADLDPVAADALRSAALSVNENHSALGTYERERFVGALIALHEAGIPVDPEALRAELLVARWDGRLIQQALELLGRVAKGQRPRHRTFIL